MQVMQKAKAESGAVMARVLLLDDVFAHAQAMSEPSESEEDPDDEEVRTRLFCAIFAADPHLQLYTNIVSSFIFVD